MVIHTPSLHRALGQGDGTGEGVGIADGYGRSRKLHHRLRGAPGEALGNERGFGSGVDVGGVTELTFN